MRSQRRPQILLAISEFFNSHRIYRRLRLRTDRAFGMWLDLRAAPIQALTALARSSTANWTPRIESFARHSQSLASGDCGNWPILLSRKVESPPVKERTRRRLPESSQTYPAQNGECCAIRATSSMEVIHSRSQSDGHWSMLHSFLEDRGRYCCR